MPRSHAQLYLHRRNERGWGAQIHHRTLVPMWDRPVIRRRVNRVYRRLPRGATAPITVHITDATIQFIV
jgi:hypothetical protein